jgi:hypothetical protein
MVEFMRREPNERAEIACASDSESLLWIGLGWVLAASIVRRSSFSNAPRARPVYGELSAILTGPRTSDLPSSQFTKSIPRQSREGRGGVFRQTCSSESAQSQQLDWQTKSTP